MIRMLATILLLTVTACTDVRYAMTPEVMHNPKTGHIVECKGSGAIYASTGLIGAQAEKDGCVEKYESLGYVRVVSENGLAQRREWDGDVRAD
jgi:hypothetical protein